MPDDVKLLFDLNVTACPYIFRAASASEIAERMIEESGAMWLEVRDRSEMGSGPIVVTESPDRAVYLERHGKYQGELPHIDGWVLIEQPLHNSDAAAFYAAFGSEWPFLLRAHISMGEKMFRVRAFIKNGRKEGWSISLDMRSEQSMSSNGRTDKLDALQAP
jgi:hypothetical protein